MNGYLRVNTFLRDVAFINSTRENKKLLGNDWDDFRFGVIMHSYVTSWGLYNETTENVLHIYSSNMPKGWCTDL